MLIVENKTLSTLNIVNTLYQSYICTPLCTKQWWPKASVIHDVLCSYMDKLYILTLALCLDIWVDWSVTTIKRGIMVALRCKMCSCNPTLAANQKINFPFLCVTWLKTAANKYCLVPVVSLISLSFTRHQAQLCSMSVCAHHLEPSLTLNISHTRLCLWRD